MLGKLARTVFGSANDRFVKKQYKIVQRINALEPEISPLSDEELKAKTEEFKQRLKTAKRLTICCPKLLPSYARPPNALSASAITMFS